MDTKWKNRKKVISFIVFFLGVSLTLTGAAELFRDKPSGVKIWQLDKLLQDDYQESARFRGYIGNRLENFLIMAVNGKGLYGIWGYNNGTYYGDGYDGTWYYGYEWDDFLEIADPYENEVSSVSLGEIQDYLYGLEGMWDGYLEILDAMEEAEEEQRKGLEKELRSREDELRDYMDAIGDRLDSYVGYRSGSGIKELTEEQKKKIAEKYHENIKGDKNLLYTISYEDKVLYSNTDLLPADGSMSAPAGYNFVLYFDGEKVRIVKDGEELDVYGDGFYREDSQWNVPGYSNFQTDEEIKKAKVCMAVAQEPVLYQEGVYASGGSQQYDNALYWMRGNFQWRRKRLVSEFACLCAGILLLALAFCSRKSRREATEGITRLQAKIWVEVKAVLFVGILYIVYMICTISVVENYGYDLWRELIYTNDSTGMFEVMRTEVLGNVPSLSWWLLFWIIYLFVNDFRHNGKIWKHGLTAKCCKMFSVREMTRPLSRKMTFRNRILFAAALLYGLLMPTVSLWGLSVHGSLWGMGLLSAAGILCFLAAVWKICGKNTETARDVEALIGRIGDIRDGNYTEHGREQSKGEKEEFVGHDLEDVMTQLEDIRHGMANAVDEQMKSERMKVELIANVSHDIKTPLTSIISYVEFLKQEKELPEHVKDYVRILDEKSQRLKNMVQDVFAVSKAASGELPMHMEALDFGKLLRQTLADMEEEIDGSAVAFRTAIPEEPVMIMADGQRMYRVFQNLFQNAIKYSLAGSRVYVTLKADGKTAAASVKNTSHRELEKDREFTERFVRGDQSRTDGGSGLGLSIAQSFTEACGGVFRWETDADLFIVTVSFGSLTGAEEPGAS